MKSGDGDAFNIPESIVELIKKEKKENKFVGGERSSVAIEESRHLAKLWR